jgi:hypothetical protein
VREEPTMFCPSMEASGNGAIADNAGRIWEVMPCPVA